MKCSYCIERENHLIQIHCGITAKIQNILNQPYISTPESKIMESYARQQEEIIKTYCLLVKERCDHQK